MKVQECFPQGRLYMSNEMAQRIAGVLPEDLEVDMAVMDVRRQGVTVIDPRRFLFLTSKHLVTLTLKVGQLEGTTEREAKLATEMIPLSAIKDVRRDDAWGFNQFNVWETESPKYTITFEPESGLSPIMLPPGGVGLDDEVHAQYKALGQAIFNRMFR